MKLTCISLNLWNGGFLFPNILPFLKTHGADILLLQEVYSADDPAMIENYRSLETLRKALGYQHEHFAAACMDKLLVGNVDFLPLGAAIGAITVVPILHVDRKCHLQGV